MSLIIEGEIDDRDASELVVELYYEHLEDYGWAERPAWTDFWV